jgi:tetratricopeptide (TPR) repeat protein
MHVIRHLFSSGEHKAVLVLGYSCSDVFDIIPQILSIQDSGIQVFFVKHSHDPNVLSIKTLSAEIGNNPFRHFFGKWIVCDTDLLIKTLWNELKDSIGPYELFRGVFDWSSEANSWFGKSNENICVKSFVTGWILQAMQRNAPLYSEGRDIQLSDKARSYYARALNLAETAKHTRMMMVCYLEMGRISLYKRAKTEKAKLVNYEAAIDYFCEAIGVAARQSTRDEDFIATCYHAIGVTHASLREADAARHCLKKSRNHYRRLTEKRILGERLSGSCLEEGVIYEEVERDYKKALECYKRAYNLVNSNGERSEPGLCITFGNAYLHLKEHPKAISCYKRAQETSDQKGDIYTLNVAYKCLSDAYRVIGDDENYKRYAKKLTESEAKLRGFR